MSTIGIDFGSSYSTVAWTNPQTGTPEAVRFNGDGSVKMPSTMLFSSGGLIIGFQAFYYIEEIFKLPDGIKLEMLSNFIPSLKRILNPTATELFGTGQFSHEQLLTEFFKHLFSQVSEHCGHDFVISDVSFSYPVEFEEDRIELLRRALTNTGVSAITGQMEPVAAALGYAQNHRIAENECLLVFDFGGGTIDVACVQKRPSGFRLVCQPKGSNTCGGQDIDQLLYDDLQKKVLNQVGIDISENGLIDYSILNSCRRMKELFSGGNDSYEITVPLVRDGHFHTFRYSLNRGAFENIIYPKVFEAISIARQVAENARSNGYEATKILLIGGSSKLSLVSRLLAESFCNATIETCGEKDIAVALGNLMADSHATHDNSGADAITEERAETEAVTDIPVDRNRSIRCRNEACGSEQCFKLLDEPGYICLECGWKGRNITVIF